MLYGFKSTINDRRRGNARLNDPIFLLALVAAVFGFSGIAGALAWIAWIVLAVFVVLFLVSLIAHLGRGSGHGLEH